MFGRKKDEGGIPGLSGSSTRGIPGLGGSPTGDTTRPTGIPGSEAQPEPRPPRDPTSSRLDTAHWGKGRRADGAASSEPRRRRKIGRWTVRCYALAFVAVVAVIVASRQEGGVDGIVDRANRSIERVRDAADREPAAATSMESLLREHRLTPALAAARKVSPPNATVESLRLTPTQLDVTVAQRDGRRFAISVDPALFAEVSDAGAAEPAGLAWSRVPTDVPERLIRTIERKLGLKPDDLDYVLLNTGKSSFDGRRTDSWGAYYSEPPLRNDATAALDGTDVRLIGTPDAKTRATMRASARRTLASLAQAERQIKASSLPEAARRQALTNIRRTRALAKKNLEAAGG